MNLAKQQYLQAVRADSAYPIYRGFIGTLSLLGYVLAGAIALGTIIGTFSSLSTSFWLALSILVIGAVFCATVFLSAKLSKEAALMLADIADATVDASARVRN